MFDTESEEQTALSSRVVAEAFNGPCHFTCNKDIGTQTLEGFQTSQHKKR
jgi:hypothetical protein